MPASSVAGLAPVIEVKGSPLAAAWLDKLSSAKIQRGLGLAGRATLRFVDPGFGLSSSSIFGLDAEVEIRLPGSQGGALFTGFVTGVSLEQGSTLTPELVVVVDDAAVKLAASTRKATYLKTKHTDVVQRLARGAGLTASVDASSETFDYLLQTGTDLAYLNSIAAQTGMVWWVSGKTLNLKKPAARGSAVTLRLGETLHAFAVRATALAPTEVQVTGWLTQTQAPVVGRASTGPSAESTFVSDYRGRSASAASAQVADLSPGTHSEATARADALLDEAAAGAVVARGTCLVAAALGPMTAVSVEDAGPASGTYLVSEVEHVYNHAGFVTHFVAGPRRPTGLVDVLGPREADPGTRMDGVVVAKVTNIGGSGSDAPEGRVKVKFPSLSDEVESAWARIATVGGGPERGLVFHPEVNDEVLVAFEGGDTRRPVVIGGLFSEKAALPKGKASLAEGKVQFRRIASRRGHVVELADGDAPADDHILLKHGGKDFRIRLGADRVDIEAADVPIAVSNGKAKVELAANGDVAISGVNVSIKAQKDVTIEGLNVAVTAKVEAKVEGTTVGVKAKAQGTVEAGGPLVVKGATVAIN